MKVDKTISDLIAEYKNARICEEKTYKNYMSIYNDWEKLAFADGHYRVENDEELELKAQLNIAYKAYEDAKNELRFISKYALDALIKEFDL